MAEGDETREELERRLRSSMLPATSGAAFSATRQAGLARVEPLTGVAQAWLRQHATEEASWDGDALVVEMRYFPALAEAIIDAGFAFERDPLPN